MIRARRASRALQYGDYAEVLLTNRQYIFERRADGERVLCAFNADGAPYTAHFNANCGRAVELITGEAHDFGGGSELPPYSASLLALREVKTQKKAPRTGSLFYASVALFLLLCLPQNMTAVSPIMTSAMNAISNIRGLLSIAAEKSPLNHRFTAVLMPHITHVCSL